MASVNLRSLWLPLTLSALWCAGIAGVYMQNVGNGETGARDLAYTQAHSHAVQLQSVRGWNAAYGGVYVRDGANSKPNPWLPEEMRQLRTEDGVLLNLFNPAYMSRQIAESLSANAGVRLRIAGLHPLRRENSADTWEGAALDACAQGKKEVFALTEGTAPEYRLLLPLKAKEECLSCHTLRRKGDILGGISVRLDAAPFLANAEAQKRSLLIAYVLTALAGAAAVGGITFNLNRRRMLAEAAAQAKSAFLANMSHDMRTPLSSMLGMNEVLARATDASTRDKARRFLRLATQALLEMVTDITDHAAMNSGRISLTPRNFQLRHELEQCLALYRAAAQEKGLNLTLEMAAGLPEALCGDAFRLRQAVGNLISNAVKFTDHGAVTVRVSGGPAQHKGEFPLTLSVCDTGRGIPATERERIFESFERGAAASDASSGTGLGLCIVKYLAKLMGGGVSVDCPPEGGSIFTLQVRLAVAQPEAAEACEKAQAGAAAEATQTKEATKHAEAGSAADTAETGNGPEAHGAAEALHAADVPDATDTGGVAQASPAAEQLAEPAAQNAVQGGLRRLDGSALCVLAAEDTPANIFYLEECLRRGGAVVQVAQDGGKALSLLGSRPWDAALLDVRMPVMGGVALLEKIRSGTAGVPRDLPVVMFTATYGPQEQAQLAHLHPDAVLEKPVPFALLMDTLRHVCGLLPVEGQPDVTSTLVQGQPDAPSLPTLPPVLTEGQRDAASTAADGLPDSAAPAGADVARSDAATPSCAVQPAVPQASTASALFDRAAALEDMDGDEALLHTLINIFLEDVPVQLARLQQACAAGDVEGCTHIGHSLKNSAGSLHLESLRMKADLLEKAGCAVDAVEAVEQAVQECLPLLRAYNKE